MPYGPGDRRRLCDVCDSLRPGDLLELDAMLGDPARWPASVWGIFKPPEGGLPASYRRHGAQRMGRDWLDAHGYQSVRTGHLRAHIRYDVVHVPRDVAELYQLGLIRATHANRRIPADPERLDATAALRYFNLGIQSGITAHQLLIDRLNQQIERGEEPDSKLLLELVKQGATFAKTQATLQAKGLKFGDKDDEDDGFRGSDEEKPGPRIGHGRERTMEDGTRRHVRDEGPADRERYNDRAAQEGRPPLS